MDLKAQIERYLFDLVLDTVSIPTGNPSAVVEGDLAFKHDLILNAIIPVSGHLEGVIQFSIAE